MMLDHEHGIARVDEPVQHSEEALHVVEVEPGGGLVQDVEHVRGGTGGELRGDLEALRLAAR